MVRWHRMEPVAGVNEMTIHERNKRDVAKRIVNKYLIDCAGDFDDYICVCGVAVNIKPQYSRNNLFEAIEHIIYVAFDELDVMDKGSK